MTSPKQIEANRKNATKSTGPKTEKGKSISRSNATKHGLLAKSAVIEGEDPEEFRGFRDQVVDRLAPEGAIHEILAMRVADILWRLRRIPMLESSIFSLLQVQEAQQASSPANDPLNLMFSQAITGEVHAAPSASEQQLQLGSALKKALQDTDFLAKIGRYEAHLTRQLQETLSELEQHAA